MTSSSAHPGVQAENMTKHISPRPVAGLGDLRAARIGAHLHAQRVEVYRRRTGGAALEAWWAAADFVVVPPDLGVPVALSWFPWTLGNIRQARHVFVRNAESLPIRPDQGLTVGDLRMVSALHLTVPDGSAVVGGVCAYWATERPDWDDSLAERLSALALDVLATDLR